MVERSVEDKLFSPTHFREFRKDSLSEVLQAKLKGLGAEVTPDYLRLHSSVKLPKDWHVEAEIVQPMAKEAPSGRVTLKKSF